MSDTTPNKENEELRHSIEHVFNVCPDNCMDNRASIGNEMTDGQCIYFVNHILRLINSEVRQVLKRIEDELDGELQGHDFQMVKSAIEAERKRYER